MRKISCIALALAVFAVLAALAAWRIHKLGRRVIRVDVATVEKDIRDHISFGASRAEVESHLDKRGILHSYVEQSPIGPERSHEVMALIPDTSHTWLIRGDIQILFKFDDQNRLANFSVKEIFTGP